MQYVLWQVYWHGCIFNYPVENGPAIEDGGVKIGELDEGLDTEVYAYRNPSSWLFSKRPWLTWWTRWTSLDLSNLMQSFRLGIGRVSAFYVWTSNPEIRHWNWHSNHLKSRFCCSVPNFTKATWLASSVWMQPSMHARSVGGMGTERGRNWSVVFGDHG
jgi:hypothetical protein